METEDTSFDVDLTSSEQQQFLSTTIGTLHRAIKAGNVSQEYLDFLESIINGMEHRERVRDEREQSLASTPEKKPSDEENDDQSDSVSSVSLEVWTVGEDTDSDDSQQWS